MKGDEPVLPEKHINADALLGSMDAIIRDLEAGGVVYIVNVHTGDTDLIPSGMVDSEGNTSFVIVPIDAPLRSFESVYDEEYGWPVMVDLEQIESLADVAPGRRRHPLLHRGSTPPFARSLMIGEYQALKP